jgi:hypothetical protein
MKHQEHDRVATHPNPEKFDSYLDTIANPGLSRELLIQSETETNTRATMLILLAIQSSKLNNQGFNQTAFTLFLQ